MNPTLDWRSAGLACTADPRWRAKIGHGGWVLMLPFVGWPMVLGYRRAFVERILDGERPVLPGWEGQHARHLATGLEAMAVIHAAYAPLALWLALRSTHWNLWAETPWVLALAFVAVFPVFSTLLVPAWLTWLRFGVDVPGATLELLAVGLLFTVVTFLIPAGFLNVARTRRITSAFHVSAGWRNIREAPRAYVEAWLGSGVLSLCAHFCLPLAPWGVVWCYLAIVYAFGEVARESHDGTFPRAWYATFRRDHWSRYRMREVGPIERYHLASDEAPAAGPADPRFAAVRIGPLRLLLPGRAARPPAPSH